MKAAVILCALILATAGGCVNLEPAIRHEKQIESADDAVSGLERSPALQKRIAKLLLDDAVMAVGRLVWEYKAETGLSGFVLAFLGIQAKKISKKRKVKL